MNENEKLLDLAKKISKKAYAPYSKFPVGACVLSVNDKTYEGCNVENSSYGLCLCAERNAISTAIANGEKKFKKIAIFSPEKPLCFPCGACRQWLYELKSENGLTILLEDKHGKIVEYPINKLLPHGFDL